jgi:hypothetical protein
MCGNLSMSKMLLASLLTLVVAAGCVATADLYKGHPVTKVPVVALEEDGPNAGRWQTFDLAIEYQYTLNNGTLDLSGQVIPSDFYRLNFSNFRRLTVYAFALDQDDRVMETMQLVWLGGVNTDENFAFSRHFQVPAGATKLSFGYDGEAREFESKKSFYELPIDQ